MVTKEEYDEAVAFYSEFKYALFPNTVFFIDLGTKDKPRIYIPLEEKKEFERRIHEYHAKTYRKEPYRASDVLLGWVLKGIFFNTRNEDLFDSITNDLENILRDVLGRQDIEIITERHKILL